MSIEEVYASAPAGKEYVRIHALRVEVAGQEQIRFCTGFIDRMLGVNGVLEMHEAASIDIDLPSRNTSGQQTLNFAVPNMNGRVRKYIKQAMDSGEQVMLEYAEYLVKNPLDPTHRPIRMHVVGGNLDGIVATFKGSYKDLLNLAFGDKNRYTRETAPGIWHSQ